MYICSQTVACSFICLLVTFDEQKVFILMKSNSGYCSLKVPFVSSLTNLWLLPGCGCTHTFLCSSKSFLILAIIWRSVIHLKLSWTQVTFDKPSLTPCLKHLGAGSYRRMIPPDTLSLVGRTTAASLSSHHPGKYRKCRLFLKKIL